MIMALSGIFSSAVSGLQAFTTQLNNISENVANSNSLGYKQLDTNFNSYVTTSNNSAASANGVLSTNAARNSQQGALATSSNTTAIGINGAGFLPVQEPFLQGSNLLFTGNTQFTRAGDFSFNANGYLVNPQGQYLIAAAPVSGATTSSPSFASVAQLGALSPVQLTNTNRVALGAASTNVGYNINFPANATAGTAQATQIQIYDSLGNPTTIPLNWTLQAGGTNRWTLSIGTPLPANIAAGAITITPVTNIQFNSDGTLDPTGFVAAPATGATTAAPGLGSLALSIAYTAGTAPGVTSPQSVFLNLGTPASSSVPPGTAFPAGYTPGTGSTQFAGTSLQVRSVSIDGQAAGTFQSATIDDQGFVVFGYSNGTQVRQFRVPVFTFPNSDGLTRTTGQIFQQSTASGLPQPRWSSEQNAGKVTGGTLEQSNVDISQEFTKLIVAQRSYSANAKVVTTADEVIQEAIGLKR
jgi:flagellar hook protein FlgE